VVRFVKPEQAVFSPGHIVILAWDPSAGVKMAVDAPHRRPSLLMVCLAGLEFPRQPYPRRLRPRAVS